MADYKFTQTGAEIQQILNKANGLGSYYKYRHFIEFHSSTGFIRAVIDSDNNTQCEEIADVVQIMGTLLSISGKIGTDNPVDIYADQGLVLKCYSNNGVMSTTQMTDGVYTTIYDSVVSLY